MLGAPPLNGLRDVLAMDFVTGFWDGDEGWAFAATLVHLPNETVHRTSEIDTIRFQAGVGCADEIYCLARFALVAWRRACASRCRHSPA
jgi:hypothetical protein